MKVALVGGSPSWKDAPFSDEDIEIWVLGNQLDRYKDKRINRIFEIHDDISQHPDVYPQWLVDQKLPLIVGEKFPVKGKNIDVFPYGEAEALIGFSYFTSSPACMIAYALLKGAKEISIYGIDMAVDDHEYFMQRPAMEGWICFAKGMGVDVRIHESSPLCKYDYIEGRDWGTEGRDLGLPPFTEKEFLAMAKQHQDNKDQLLEQIRQLQANIQTHDGARQAYVRLAQVSRSIEAGNKITNLTDGVVIGG